MLSLMRRSRSSTRSTRCLDPPSQLRTALARLRIAPRAPTAACPEVGASSVRRPLAPPQVDRRDSRRKTEEQSRNELFHRTTVSSQHSRTTRTQPCMLHALCSAHIPETLTLSDLSCHPVITACVYHCMHVCLNACLNACVAVGRRRPRARARRGVRRRGADVRVGGAQRAHAGRDPRQRRAPCAHARARLRARMHAGMCRQAGRQAVHACSVLWPSPLAAFPCRRRA